MRECASSSTSGIPTAGNVHEIAQEKTPDARVVYVDIDPIAVAESLDLLKGNDLATAVRADIRYPQEVLDHPRTRRLLDFDRPIAVMMAAVLHFVPDDAEAYELVARFVETLAPGSYVVVSHIATESFIPGTEQRQAATEVYERQTATPIRPRDRAEVRRFFAGLELLNPDLIWPHEWRLDENAAAEFAELRLQGAGWVGVGRRT
jgi:trans-aconitate methyltransferase